MSGLSPRVAYEQVLQQGHFVPDAAQDHAVDQLETLYQQVCSGRAQAGGVYLWGPVGRGKTWLMDHFHASLSVPARRQHFHHFMRWVHQRLFQLSGTADPVRKLAADLAGETQVLCLDEFFVSDIGDAMLLGRLVQQLFEQKILLVMTSNQPPEQLYADGFHHDRFLPAARAIQQHMQVVNLDGGQDHRLHPGEVRQRYWVRGADEEQALGSVFEQLCREQAQAYESAFESAYESVCEPVIEPVELGHRKIQVVKRCESLVWFRYADLCEQPLAAMDFIQLCDQYSMIMLSDVPCLSAQQQASRIARGTEDAAEQVKAGDRELPRLSRQDDGVRRFIALVDECYDRQVPLYLEAAVPLDQLYPHGHLAFPFRRTLSRLKEMQLARFGQALIQPESLTPA